jgi:hypothetical protein
MRISAGERARWAEDRTTGVPTKGREPRGLFVFLRQESTMKIDHKAGLLEQMLETQP